MNTSDNTKYSWLLRGSNTLGQLDNLIASFQNYSTNNSSERDSQTTAAANAGTRRNTLNDQQSSWLEKFNQTAQGIVANAR
jgi:hypothetical protein